MSDSTDIEVKDFKDIKFREFTGDCIHNKAIMCNVSIVGTSICEKCGWNPAVQAKRLAEKRTGSGATALDIAEELIRLQERRAIRQVEFAERREELVRYKKRQNYLDKKKREVTEE